MTVIQLRHTSAIIYGTFYAPGARKFRWKWRPAGPVSSQLARTIDFVVSHGSEMWVDLRSCSNILK